MPIDTNGEMVTPYFMIPSVCVARRFDLSKAIKFCPRVAKPRPYFFLSNPNGTGSQMLAISCHVPNVACPRVNLIGPEDRNGVRIRIFQFEQIEA